MEKPILKLALISIAIFILSESSFALNADEAYTTLKEADRKIEDSKIALAKLEIKSDSMIEAWKVRKKLGDKPFKDLTPSERRELDKANVQLKSFDESIEQKKLDPAKVKDFENQVDQQIERTEKIAAETKAAMEYAKQHKDEMASKHPDIDSAIDNGTETRLEAGELGQQGLKIKNSIDEIEADIEKTQMAAYVADKMAQFMNSDSFCRAKNHCSNPNTEDPVDPQYLYQEVFRDVPDKWQRKEAQSTYDKVHAGRKKKQKGKSQEAEPDQNQ